MPYPQLPRLSLLTVRNSPVPGLDVLIRPGWRVGALLGST